MRILGIDPGSRRTGYGVLDLVGKQTTLVSHGVIETGTEDSVHADRLFVLYTKLREVLLSSKPDVVSVEKIFFAKNAVSALRLGQARGVILLACAQSQLPIFEYNPTEVKSALVGNGRASKEEVAKMLKIIFGNQDFATADASDGIALAYCHTRWAGVAKATVRSSKKMRLSELLGLE